MTDAQIQNMGRALFDREVELGRLREGIRAALDELGVPNEGYPAPVVNAVDILSALLRGGETDG